MKKREAKKKKNEEETGQHVEARACPVQAFRARYTQRHVIGSFNICLFSFLISTSFSSFRVWQIPLVFASSF
jgi:hypothetical protein